MLAKLVKYDFLALGRILLPLQLGVFASCVLCSAYLAFRFRSMGVNTSYSSTDQLLDALLGFGLLLFFAVVVTVDLLTIILVARHFYLNSFSEEGYLMMTLPVTAHQRLMAKLISGYTWVLINVAVLLLGVLLIVFLGTASEGLINTEAAGLLGDALGDVARRSPALLFVYPLSVLLLSFSQLVSLYFCLAAGASWAKRHKVALAFLLFFAVSTVTGIITTIIDEVVTRISGLVSPLLSLSNYRGFYDYYLATAFVDIAVSILTILVFYVFTRHLLGKRLNLE
jgi:hypothetical protein